MKKIIIGLLMLPFCLYAVQIRVVTISEKDDVFVFTARNTESKTIIRPEVFVASSPSWLKFMTNPAFGDSIPPGSSRDFQFKIKVMSQGSGVSSRVVFFVNDRAGKYHSREDLIITFDSGERATTHLSAYLNPTKHSTAVQYAVKKKEVTISAKDDTFVYTASNNESKTIIQPIVFVASLPPWLKFITNSVIGDSIPAGSSRDYRFKIKVMSGGSGKSGRVHFFVIDRACKYHSSEYLVIKTGPEEKAATQLAAYPNPANPSTTFQFTLTEAGFISIRIFNVLGQTVRTLLNEKKPAGEWETYWDGQNDRGIPASSGIYIVQMGITIKNETRNFRTKITLVR
jgi:hypothetical protein